MQHVDLLELRRQLSPQQTEESKLVVDSHSVKKVFKKMTEMNPWLKQCLHAEYFQAEQGFYDYERLLTFCLLYCSG